MYKGAESVAQKHTFEDECIQNRLHSVLTKSHVRTRFADLIIELHDTLHYINIYNYVATWASGKVKFSLFHCTVHKKLYESLSIRHTLQD